MVGTACEGSSRELDFVACPLEGQIVAVAPEGEIAPWRSASRKAIAASPALSRVGVGLQPEPALARLTSYTPHLTRVVRSKACNRAA